MTPIRGDKPWFTDDFPRALNARIISVVPVLGWCDLGVRIDSHSDVFEFLNFRDFQSFPWMERPVLARLGNLAEAGSSEKNRLHGILGNITS